MTSYDACRRLLLSQYTPTDTGVVWVVPSFAATTDDVKDCVSIHAVGTPNTHNRKRPSRLEQLCQHAARQLEACTDRLNSQMVLVAIWCERSTQPCRHIVWGWTTTVRLYAHPGLVVRKECYNSSIPPTPPRTQPMDLVDIIHCDLNDTVDVELPTLEKRVRSRMGTYLHLIDHPRDPVLLHLVHTELTADNYDLASSRILMNELPFDTWRACEAILIGHRLETVYRGQLGTLLKSIIEVDNDKTVSMWGSEVLSLVGQRLVAPVLGRVALTPFVVHTILVEHVRNHTTKLDRYLTRGGEQLYWIRAWVRATWQARDSKWREPTPNKTYPPCVRHMISRCEKPVMDKRNPLYLRYEQRKFLVRALLSFGMPDTEVERLVRTRAQIVYAGNASKLATRTARKDMWINTYLRHQGALKLTCKDIKRKEGWCPGGMCRAMDIEEMPSCIEH